MAYYKVKVVRCLNPPKAIIVNAPSSQQAIRIAAGQLRDEGITDARAIEVIGRVKSFRE
jgi:hypothetical protein